MQTRTGISTAILAAASVLGPPATAATQRFVAKLVELNGSGVTGSVHFDVDRVAQTLHVGGLTATFDDGSPALHVNHVHGRFDGDGNPRNSVTPTMADDANGDGFVDVFEGLPNYGDVLLSLEPNPTPASNHNGPFADADGRLSYHLT